jgi:hypothetical protein
MSVPLDRLYSFLDGISNHALLIYGWRPHGSKKLQDLVPWKPFPRNWQLRKTQPTLIFHDQEPLDYSLSQISVEQEFCLAIEKWKESELLLVPEVQKFYKTLHLQSIVEHTFYDQTLLVHSEQNSAQVEKYRQNNFVPVYYWSHAVISRDWFRFAEYDTDLKVKASSPRTFLIYNRAWSGTREYRLKFAEQLIAKNLHHSCITSFAAMDDQVHYRDHVFSNPAFEPELQDLEKALPQNTHDSAASADYNNYDYQNSLIEVVLETLFDDTRNHLTEKALRPIACGQPFILASTPGSLQYLRSYGFQTFSGYINEAYDTVQDPVQRLNAIVQEMQRIDQLDPADKQQLIAGVQAIVDHNQRWFFSEEFYNLVLNEFKQNLDCAVAAVKSGPVGNVWKGSTAVLYQHCPEHLEQLLHRNAEELEWAQQWLETQIKS